MSALCRAGGVHWDVVKIVGVILQNKASVEASVVENGAPIVRVLSCAVYAAEVL
jgi:hypothetical protein